MITLAALVMSATLSGAALGVVISCAMERFDARHGEPRGANRCQPRCVCGQGAKVAQDSPQARERSSDRPDERPDPNKTRRAIRHRGPTKREGNDHDQGS